MGQEAIVYHKREFWADENLKYQKPHFRLEKTARLVNKLADGRACDLLDVGCGPAALRHLLKSNINYYGIDIAIHEPSDNLIETDFVEGPVQYGDRQFDIVVAQGVFEYIGGVQQQKLAEIRDLLRTSGTFIATYVNFDHRNRNVYWPYNNIQSFSYFRASLRKFFIVDRHFPTSHRWRHDEPRDRLQWALQKHININIPVLSRMFGVEYFFICKKK